VRVADELGDAELLDQLAVGVEAGIVDAPLLATGLGPLALGGHLGAEPSMSTCTSRSPAISWVSSSGNP
jgi:hypothetical protein